MKMLAPHNIRVVDKCFTVKLGPVVPDIFLKKLLTIVPDIWTFFLKTIDYSSSPEREQRKKYLSMKTATGAMQPARMLTMMRKANL